MGESIRSAVIGGDTVDVTFMDGIPTRVEYKHLDLPFQELEDLMSTVMEIVLEADDDYQGGDIEYGLYQPGDYPFD